MMAARLNPKNDERARSAIQTTQLCKRLNSFALALPDPQTRKPVEMSSDQVRAALGLLRKTIPDLAVTTIAGDAANPVSFVIRAPSPVESTQQWLAQYAPKTIDAQPAEPLQTKLSDDDAAP